MDSKISGSPKAHFSQVQMNPILNDYVEAAIMLDYNDRDVAAAWYKAPRGGVPRYIF